MSFQLVNFAYAKKIKKFNNYTKLFVQCQLQWGCNYINKLVPIIQDNMSKLPDDTKEGDKGSEISLAFKYN